MERLQKKRKRLQKKVTKETEVLHDFCTDFQCVYLMLLLNEIGGKIVTHLIPTSKIPQLKVKKRCTATV